MSVFSTSECGHICMPHVTVETVILLGMGPMEVSYMVFLLNHSTFPVVLASWRIPVQLAKTYEHWQISFMDQHHRKLMLCSQLRSGVLRQHQQHLTHTGPPELETLGWDPAPMLMLLMQAKDWKPLARLKQTTVHNTTDSTGASWVNSTFITIMNSKYHFSTQWSCSPVPDHSANQLLKNLFLSG